MAVPVWPSLLSRLPRLPPLDGEVAGLPDQRQLSQPSNASGSTARAERAREPGTGGSGPPAMGGRPDPARRERSDRGPEPVGSRRTAARRDDGTHQKAEVYLRV